STTVFPDFDVDRTIHASAIVFSPDGSTLYIATSTLLHSSSSDGETSPNWSTELADTELCDMAISPDGLSVYVLGCGLRVVYHVRVDISGNYVSTEDYSTNAADVGGSDAGDMFLMEVFEHSVVIGRETSDEIAVFQRDYLTGVLSSATTVNILDETELVGGVIAGFTASTTKLFVAMASAGATGGIVVFDVTCIFPPSPAPTTLPDVCAEYDGIVDPEGIVCCSSLCDECKSNTYYNSGTQCGKGSVLPLGRECASDTPAPCGLQGELFCMPVHPTPAPSPAPSPSPSPAPSPSPSPAPSPAPSPSPSVTPTSPPLQAPTVLSTAPELVEAKLAAAAHGVDLLFEPALGSSAGLWCRGETCSDATCAVTDLLDSDTTVSAGTGAECGWEDGTTARITFGPGSTLTENSTVVLNSESEYISGCATCTEYSSGSATVKARDPPPELSAAQFTNTGAQQVTVDFTGNPSSQEINGTFSAVSCESVFSAASASTLGTGSTCQFSSRSSIKVTLGVLSSIAPSASDACTDGDGTSLTLLAGVVRTEIGAFLTTSAGCVVVNFPGNPDPPYVAVSAPSAIGHCDDLTLEGSATSALIGTTNVTWQVALTGSSFADISNATRLLEEASLETRLTVIVPSEYMAQGFSYTFVLRVETALGGSSTAEVEVFKSPAELLLSKIVGSSVVQRMRGSAITLRSETTTSSCSTTNTDEALASYSWGIASANESFAGGADVTLDVGRDPRLLVIPPYALGYAGSSYQFQLRTTFGGIASTVNATVEVVSGAVVAAIAGGSSRRIGVSQVLKLDASASVDDDDIATIPFDFTWRCESHSGDICVSGTGQTLDISSSENEAILSIPANSLPTGVEYVFSVTVSKGSNGGPAWSQRRSGNTSCTVSTSSLEVPAVAINPKEVRRKYNPSSRLVLYGCAAASTEDRCSNSSTAGFDFTWDQVDSDREEAIWSDVFSTEPTHPTQVVRPGSLSAGRIYTFSLVASDSLGNIGYTGDISDCLLDHNAEFAFETNAPPVGGYVVSDILRMTSGEDKVLLETTGWTDDFDDLPVAYEFGYTHGRLEVFSVSSELWVTMLSSGASYSSSLYTHMPPGMAANGFNVTVVAYASDILGSTAVTSLGADNEPLALMSTPPDQVSLSSMRNNISSLSDQRGSLVDPADSLREAAMLSAILEHIPEPDTAEELAEIIELKETIVATVAEAYFALESTTAAVRTGAETLARAFESSAESGPISNAAATVVSEAVGDMIERSALDGQVPESGAAVSLLQIVSVLLSANDSSSGTEVSRDLLGNLGKAVAIGSEAGENLDQISAESLDLQAAKFSEASIQEALLNVGNNGTRVSFAEWTLPPRVEDNSTVVVAVASLAMFASEGLASVTSINAWDTTGQGLHDFEFPISFSARTEGTEERRSREHAPVCVSLGNAGETWVTDGIAVDSFHASQGGSTETTCETYHLSPFALAVEEGLSAEWVTADLLPGAGVLRQYGAESWPAILFLVLVASLFLVPALLLYREDAKHGRGFHYAQILRELYLTRGRCSREDQPVQIRIQERKRRAHQEVNKNNQLDSGYLRVHKISRTTQKDHLAKTIFGSVLMNHAWSHLRSSPTAHFKKTLLTRSQHLVLLLADWMSAVALQAVFYGKSQFSIRDKAQMTAATALFMIPTALVFPVLLRKANTPPISRTVTNARRAREGASFKENPGRHAQYGVLRHRRPQDMKAPQDDEQETALSTKRTSVVRGTFVTKIALQDPPTLARRRHKKPSAFVQPPTVVEGIGGVSANKTAIYRDIIMSQRMIVALYLILPVWMAAIFVPMVVLVAVEANSSPEGDPNALVHNLTASLGIVCSLLCVYSAYGVGAHRVIAMTKAMAFQAIVAPGLVLCGAMLFDSDAGLATGAVISGLACLLCSYLTRLQRKNEQVLKGVCEQDLITAWSNPTRDMHSAATVVQRSFRMHSAATRMARAAEFSTWLNNCKPQRSCMYILVNSTIYLTILCLTYTNLVFAARFDRPTCTDWLTTCVLALMVEATLQQPVVLLMTGVLGDFVEEGADFLLEVLDF
ncbi:unnamed protein product, partial [Ectocarpus fasciculatus]